jgi:hypothetical protein
MEFIKDLWLFLKERKKWWLVPVIVVILFLGVLLIFAESSAIGSFIYTLFLANNCSAMNTKKKGRAYEDVLGITLGCFDIVCGFSLAMVAVYCYYYWRLELVVKKSCTTHQFDLVQSGFPHRVLVSAVLLALVFFLLLTPLACLYRLFNSGNLMGNNEDSMYKSRDHLYSGDDLRNIW